MVRLTLDGKKAKQIAMEQCDLTEQQWFSLFYALKIGKAILDVQEVDESSERAAGKRVKLEIEGSTSVFVGVLTEL